MTSRVMVVQQTRFLPPIYFSTHMNQILSPWRWRKDFTPIHQNKYLLYGVISQNMTTTHNCCCTHFCHYYCPLSSLSPQCFAQVLFTSIWNVSAQNCSHLTSAPSHHHICSCWLVNNAAYIMCRYIYHTTMPNFRRLALMLN
jgi:hypothetical protein